MTPPIIASQAVRNGLGLIAVCDHNASANVRAVRAACRSQGVEVLGGIEVCTREEIHILAIFQDDSALNSMQEWIDSRLPDGNDPEAFGEQIVADENGRAVAIETKLLVGAVDLGLEEILDGIHSRGGLAAASHADRETNGIVGQLGFIPEGIRLDAVEISRRCSETVRDAWIREGRIIIRSSDAHFPEEIGRCWIEFDTDQPDLQGLQTALRSGSFRTGCRESER